jgi:hypothetical protein
MSNMKVVRDADPFNQNIIHLTYHYIRSYRIDELLSAQKFYNQ